MQEANINPLGFREYDARWLYPKDINQEGIKKVGQGLGTQIISKTIKSPRVIEIFSMSNFLKLLLAIAAVSGQPSNVKTCAFRFAFAK